MFQKKAAAPKKVAPKMGKKMAPAAPKQSGGLLAALNGAAKKNPMQPPMGPPMSNC